VLLRVDTYLWAESHPAARRIVIKSLPSIPNSEKMCGRYVVVSKVVEIESRFGVSMPFDFPPAYNLGPGSKVPVITDEKPDQVQLFTFGLTPFWSQKRMYLFNARAEGNHNKNDDPQYAGAMGIIEKPAFRKAIRSKRCLIIADAFIEGSTKERLDKPYVVHLGQGKCPFAFAGIWDSWVDKESGEIVHSCAIITTTPNDLLMRIPHHRSPVILSRAEEARWLDSSLPLAEVTALLRPYSDADMNAYPIDKAIKHPRANGPELLKPLGPHLKPETATAVEETLKLQGMGWSRARERK
jgi:putative SOS response-associated peptidase YedK